MTMSPSTPQPLYSTVSQPPTQTQSHSLNEHDSATPRRKRVSEAVYWKKYYDYVGPEDHQYEWNDGYLEERPSHNYISFLMYSWLEILLSEYLQEQPVAKKIGLGMGFRLALLHKTVIRKPDLGVVLNSNPVPLGP